MHCDFLKFKILLQGREVDASCDGNVDIAIPLWVEGSRDKILRPWRSYTQESHVIYTDSKEKGNLQK